jgi:phage terminase large subunit-like protein
MSMVIADEVHLMKSDVYNATVIGAGQVQDSLVFSITTAGDEDSHLLLDLYAKLRENTEGFGGIVWEADEKASVGDLEQLKKANPALAEGRMRAAQVLQEVAMLPEPEARRYRLNRFIATENNWLPYSAWSDLPRLTADDEATNAVLVIDRTPEWSAATVCVAWKVGESIYTDVVASLVNPDLQALTNLMTRVCGNVPHTKVYMDGLSLGELHQALKLRGLQAEKLSKRDHLQAAAIAYQKVLEGRVVHAHHQMVAWQLGRVTTKNTGDAYRLTRPNVTVEIDAATATVLSIYLAEVQQEIPTQVF